MRRYAIRLDGPWNNSYMAMGDIFEHMERHGCDPDERRRGKRCWRVRKLVLAFERLKARGL